MTTHAIPSSPMQTLEQQLIKACENGDALTVEQLLQQGANPNAQERWWPKSTALHIAVKNGYTPIITLLIQYGADPNTTDEDGQTALHHAVENQYYDIAQYLLTQPQLNPNIQDQLGRTPFFLATQRKDIKMLQLLAQHGADPNIPDHNGQSAIHHAFEKQYHDITQYLLTQLKLDPNTQDYNGITPFLIATKNGDIHMLKRLIQLGANPYTTDYKGQTALHHAVKNLRYETAEYLLTQLNLDPNTQDRRGITPFTLAAQNGDINLLQLLIQHGANPHIKDYIGRSVLHYTVEKQCYDIAQYLITQLQLDPNAQDYYDGITPLMIAISKRDIQILQLLIQHGADPDITNRRGETALHYAVENRLHDFAQYLLTHTKTNPNIKDESERTPFLIAALHKDIKMLRILSQHGANSNIKDRYGEHPIHYATSANHHPITQFLITELHVDPNTQDKSGKTPFLIATINGNIKMLQLLIQLGANPYVTDNQGRSALHYAVLEKYHDIARYLITELKLDPNLQDQWGDTPFMLAIKNNDIEMVKILVQLGANPYVTDHQGRTALHYTAKYYECAVFEYLITQLKLDPNAQDHDGNTPFLIAIQKGIVNNAKKLIQCGANPHITDYKGRSALHYAIEKLYYDDFIQYLITELKLDPNSQDDQGITPLMIAIENNKTNKIKKLNLLISLGANPYIQDAQGRNVLHHAIEKKYHDVTQYLITQLKLDPNSQDKDGITPFMIAVQKNDFDILQLLAQHGADPNATDHQGRSALHYALEKRYRDIAEYLITQLKINPNTQDNNGYTPFLIAILDGDTHMLELLIQHGADPYVKDKKGQTALHYAVETEYCYVAQYLLTELQIDPNSQDHKGITPLMLAAQKGNIVMLQILIENGANPYTTDRKGQTAIHHALEKQHCDIVKHLITEFQFDPNIQSKFGYTPFLLATLNGDIDILELLIQHGADPYVKDKKGRSALHYAVEKQYHYVALYLLTQLQFDPNTLDKDGIAPLMIAAQKGDTGMIRFLMQFGANPHITDHKDRTALHYAAESEYDNPQETRFLITVLDLNPNSQDLRGNTPLHIALPNGHHETAKTLIQLGANPYIPNRKGQTPTAIARRRQIPLEKPQPSTITL